MKIDYVIVSTNDNPLYYEFWDIVKNLWINLIGIKPILVKIGDNDNIIDYGEFIIHTIKKVDDLDTGFQSQIARMYVTKFYGDKVCLTSDIDMLPLNKNFFTKNIEKLNNDSLVIFSSDAYKNKKRFPICYNAANGNLFNEILNLNKSFYDYAKHLNSLNLGWDTDELYFGEMVHNYYNQNKIIYLNRGWNNGLAINRIDRFNWKYDSTKVSEGYYIDSHLLRPYSKYSKEINELINLI
jgi:hypothetical protein